MAAHSMLPLEHWGSAAFGLVLGIAGHAVGWPIARGGAQKLIDALAAHLRSLGGEIISKHTRADARRAAFFSSGSLRFDSSPAA